MGINKQSETAASLQIGPTSLGMVRLYLETETIELPLDFEPDEAEEIAEELLAAAARARHLASAAGPGSSGDAGSTAGRSRGGQSRSKRLPRSGSSS